jgi:hypothetical protein
MDKTILVENIDKGKILLDELKKERIKINDALWVYNEDDGYWKLIITSPLVKKEGPLQFYKMIDKIMRKRNIKSGLQYDVISVMEPNDNLIKMLRAAYEVRNKIFHNVPLQDAYIYFMSN